MVCEFMSFEKLMNEFWESFRLVDQLDFKIEMFESQVVGDLLKEIVLVLQPPPTDMPPRPPRHSVPSSLRSYQNAKQIARREQFVSRAIRERIIKINDLIELT